MDEYIGAPFNYDCGEVTEISSDECEALVALYNSTDGDKWTNNSNWLLTNTPCSWYGVTCEESHVTSIDLVWNELNGSMPAALADLTNLQELILSTNQLSGNIPVQLGNLADLETINLGYCQLSGNIPDQLGNLSNLQSLLLMNNQLDGSIPSALGNLLNLTNLDLGFNQLVGSIPLELGNLSNLEILNLGNNQLSGGIPLTLGNLPGLRDLTLRHNQLDGAIPSQLGNLNNLEALNIGWNNLTGNIPPELGNLSSLRTLYLHANQLSGNIPAVLGNLTSLTGFYIGSNLLTGILPSELGSLVNVEVFSIEKNALEGEIPFSITNMVNLGTDFGYNKLTGSNPAVVAFLDAKDPDWDETQTVPPTDLATTDAYTTGLDIAWTSINYTEDGGYYEVEVSTQPDGGFILHGDTLTKTASTYAVGGLLPGTIYYVRLRTYTPIHGIEDQKNELWSNFSAVISDTTTAAGTQVSVPLEEDTTVVYTDTEGTETVIEIPLGAVTEEVTIAYIPVSTMTEFPDFIFAGQSFELNAYQDGVQIDGFTFQKPVTITLGYKDADIVELDESTLLLNYWEVDTSTWIDSATTCVPPSEYERHPGENLLAVPICHLSTFGLFGTEITEYKVYLPMSVRP